LMKYAFLLKHMHQYPDTPEDREPWEEFCQSRIERMATNENLHVPGAIANMDGTSLTKGQSDEEDTLDIGPLTLTDAAAGPATDAAAADEGKKKKKRKNRKRKNKGKGKAQATDDDDSDVEESGVAEPVDVAEPVVPEPKGKARATDKPVHISGPNTLKIPGMTVAFGPGPTVPSTPEDNGEGPSTRSATPAAARPAVDPITLVPNLDAGLEGRRRPLTQKAANDRLHRHLNEIIKAPYPNPTARRIALARARQQIMHSEVLAAARGEQSLRPTAPRARPAPAPAPAPAPGHVPGSFQFGTLRGWDGELEAMMVEGMRKRAAEKKKPAEEKK